MSKHNCHICGSEWCRGKCWDKSIETVRVDCLFDGRLTYYRSPDRILEFVDKPQEDIKLFKISPWWYFIGFIVIVCALAWIIVGVIL